MALQLMCAVDGSVADQADWPWRFSHGILENVECLCSFLLGNQYDLPVGLVYMVGTRFGSRPFSYTALPH